MNPKSSLLPTVLLTACIVAVIDGLAAVLLTLSYGGQPIRVFQYIASGIAGVCAFNGGLVSAGWGLVLHFGISLLWTIFFVLVHAFIFRFIKSALLRTILYGTLIWIIMNLVILPMSHVTQRPFDVNAMAIGIAILIVAAGAPIVYMFDRMYQKTRS